jgi:hypothetical protein
MVPEQKEQSAFSAGRFGIPNGVSRYSKDNLAGQASERSFLARASPLLLLAVVLSAGFAVHRMKHESKRASLNTQCTQLAQRFGKVLGGDTPVTEVIAGVYSPRRNSCLAAVEHRDNQRYFVQVVDPATGEVVWSDGCRIPDNCNEPLMSSIRTRSKIALDKIGSEP